MAEGALRVMKRKVPFQPDPDLIRSLRPNVDAEIFTYESDANWNSERAPRPPLHLAGKSRTNNIGFRMAEDVGPKAADERRVLLLGDSYTEADQVRAISASAISSTSASRRRRRAGRSTGGS